MRKRLYILLMFLLLGLHTGCGGGSDSPSLAGDYLTPPPVGKLPWPQHDPAFSKVQYQEMMNNLWVNNNFGQYQGGTDPTDIYLHDGLDSILPNGTKIFAIQSGYVKAIIDCGEYYCTLIIEDENNPGYAWSYTHIYYFQVEVGQFVKQGSPLGQIHFHELEHIHLSRLQRISSEKSWSDFSNHQTLSPDSFFSYQDTQPPIIETPFRYFQNESNTLLNNSLSGDVDIVVGIRDQGEYAHSKDNGYGDRLAISRIEYRITGNGLSGTWQNSFDFSKLGVVSFLDGMQRNLEQTSTIYKYYYDIPPHNPTSTPDYNKIFSYYIITNTDNTGSLVKNSSWHTAGLTNGEYTITIRVYDYNRNMREISEVVTLNN